MNYSKLQKGDQVYWRDPDEGIGSRIYTIETISLSGDIVRIMESDGSVLECFKWELL